MTEQNLADDIERLAGGERIEACAVRQDSEYGWETPPAVLYDDWLDARKLLDIVYDAGG